MVIKFSSLLSLHDIFVAYNRCFGYSKGQISEKLVILIASSCYKKSQKVEYVCCEKNCQMFKGFSICSHVVVTAQINGQLESYLTDINGICKLNLPHWQCKRCNYFVACFNFRFCNTDKAIS